METIVIGCIALAALICAVSSLCFSLSLRQSVGNNNSNVTEKTRGIPVLYCSADALEAMGGQDEAFKLLQRIHANEQSGVVLPLGYNEQGNPLVKLEWLQ